MIEEVLLCASGPAAGNASLGSLSLNDIQTGTSVFSLKQTGAGRNGLALVESKGGQGGFVLCLQSEKALLQSYSFQKDQTLTKMVLPEKMCCIAVDKSGQYAACGTVNGRIYLWEIPSGVLFNSWEAHYRKVTALRFTDDGAALVSGSEDSAMHLWEISSLVDNQLSFEIPSPYCSFTAHTLTITDIIVGLGTFPLCRIMSSSLDSSVKVWDLKSKSILSTFSFPSPITTLAWDRTERIFFASSLKGNVHRINLYRKRQDRIQTLALEAVGGGAANGEHVQIATLDGETARLISVGEPVTCMSMTINSNNLLLGLESGLVNVYDVTSHQLLRSITTHKGQPIVMVGSMIKPFDLMGHIEIGETSTSREDLPIRSILPFQRIRDPRAREAHDVSILLPPSNTVPLTSYDNILSDIMREHTSFTREEAPTKDSSDGLRDRVSELEAEVSRLRGQLSQAKNINDTMWETLAQKVLVTNSDSGPNSNSEQDMIPLEDGNATRKRARV